MWKPLVMGAAVILLTAPPGYCDDKLAADDKNLPKVGAGDPKITYDEVAKDPAKYRGKRVTWPAMPATGSGKEAACAVNPDAKDARDYKMYALRFDTDNAVQDLFFADAGTITGTVSGQLEISYEVTGPGGVGKEKRKVKVPLLVHPKHQPNKKK